MRFCRAAPLAFLLVAAEGSISFPLSTHGRDPPLPVTGESAPYRGPISLAASAGKAVTHRILASTVDPAGNRSRAMPAGSATIDQATVYAAPDGSDAAGGTRAEPVRSVARAIDIAARTGRLVVRLAYGEYPVDAGIRLSQGMTVLGGLEEGTWLPAGLGRRSVLVPSAYFRPQGTLLSAAAGAVTLSGIELRDGAVRTASLLSLAGTALAARDISFLIQGEGTRAALSASAASVTISESSFRAERAGTTALAEVAGGTMTITGCTFTGPLQSSDFVCLAATGSARIVVTGSVLDPGSGPKVRGIRAVDASVTLENTRISSGAGRLEAAAVDLRGGALQAGNCDFAARADAAAPACIIANGATVAIEASRLEVSGQTGAAGVSASGGTLSIRDSYLCGGTSAEYLYLVHAVDTDVSIAATILAGGETGDLAAVLARDGRLDVESSTIVAGRGMREATAIAAHGSATLRVSSTVLASTTSNVGPAMLVRAAAKGLPEGLEILSCCFGGWERLIGFDPASGVRDAATLEALNGLDGDPLGGSIDGCISEDPSITFRGEDDYRLSPSSKCYEANIGVRGSGE